jgi:hypothetical protein
LLEKFKTVPDQNRANFLAVSAPDGELSVTVFPVSTWSLRAAAGQPRREMANGMPVVMSTGIPFGIGAGTRKAIAAALSR